MPAAIPVRIDLADGKTHLVKYGTTAHSMFEKRCDFKSVQDMLEHGVTSFTIQALLWAGLLWKRPGLTFEEAGDMIDGYIDATGNSAYDLAVPLFQAYVESRQIPKREEAKPDEKKKEDDPNA